MKMQTNIKDDNMCTDTYTNTQQDVPLFDSWSQT